jgi:hypothetical protein
LQTMVSTVLCTRLYPSEAKAAGRQEILAVTRRQQPEVCEEGLQAHHSCNTDAEHNVAAGARFSRIVCMLANAGQCAITARVRSRQHIVLCRIDDV